MRNDAMASNGTLEIEMVKSPKKQLVDGSPVSPASTSRSWMKKGINSLKSFGSSGSTRTSRAGSNPNSPGVASLSSFDSRVLQQDQENRQAEMDRLYAAVMAHDAAKKSGASIDEVERAQVEAMSAAVPLSPRPKMKLNVDVPASGGSQPQSPRSPIKAIYPPDHPQWAQTQKQAQNPITPVTPVSPIVTQVVESNMYPASPPPKTPTRMGFQSRGDGARQNAHSPPSSPRKLLHRRDGSLGGNSTTSTSSNKNRRSVREMRISRPVRVDPNDIEDQQPLTPKNYADPGAPPPVPRKDTLPPSTARTEDSQDLAAEALDEMKPLPQAQPHRRPGNLTLPVNGNGNGNGANSTISANSSTSTLPFRALGYTSSETLTSPLPTKTTYIETRRDAIGRGPQTGRTPRTGVPATPYSAYMPFSPLTPVTPRLVTRQDRKAAKKAEGKRVITEEDAVKDDKEIWGGY